MIALEMHGDLIAAATGVLSALVEERLERKACHHRTPATTLHLAADDTLILNPRLVHRSIAEHRARFP